MIKRLICFVCQAAGQEYQAAMGWGAHLKRFHKDDEVILIIVKA